MDDDTVPVLSAGSASRFKKLKTVPHFSLHLLISLVISVLGIILAATWPEGKRCEAYFIMLYARAGFWFITWIFNYFVQNHHEKLRLNGYHEFYRQTKIHKSIPFHIVSLWNTVILAISAGLQHYYGEGFLDKCLASLYNPLIYITVFSLAETVIIFIVNGSYINKVLKFNSVKSPPDALSGISTQTGSVGLLQRGNRADITELLEKQADLIQYLQQKQQNLNQKIMQMSNQLRTVTLGPHPTI